MSAMEKPEPFYIADHRALDFLNSVCAPWGEEIEWLTDGEELLSWMVGAELLQERDAQWFEQHIDPLELDKMAVKVRELRETFRAFVDMNAGEMVNSALAPKLDFINEILSSDRAYTQLEYDPEHAHFSVQNYHQWNKAEDILIPLAREMAKLVTEADFVRIKQCEGNGCPLWFLDVSKNGKRRWCSMAVCGNRAKAAAYRSRKKCCS